MNIIDKDVHICILIDSFILTIPTKNIEYVKNISPNYILSYDDLKQIYHLYYNMKPIDEEPIGNYKRYTFDFYMKSKDINILDRFFRKEKIEKILK